MDNLSSNSPLVVYAATDGLLHRGLLVMMPPPSVMRDSAICLIISSDESFTLLQIAVPVLCYSIDLQLQIDLVHRGNRPGSRKIKSGKKKPTCRTRACQ